MCERGENRFYKNEELFFKRAIRSYNNWRTSLRGEDDYEYVPIIYTERCTKNCSKCRDTVPKQTRDPLKKQFRDRCAYHVQGSYLDYYTKAPCGEFCGWRTYDLDGQIEHLKKHGYGR